MPKKFFDTVMALNAFFQAGFSFAAPLAVFVLGGLWLKNKFGLPDAFMACAVVLGVLIGAFCMFKYISDIMKTMKRMKDSEKESCERNRDKR